MVGVRIATRTLQCGCRSVDCDPIPSMNTSVDGSRSKYAITYVGRWIAIQFWPYTCRTMDHDPSIYRGKSARGSRYECCKTGVGRWITIQLWPCIRWTMDRDPNIYYGRHVARGTSNAMRVSVGGPRSDSVHGHTDRWITVQIYELASRHTSANAWSTRGSRSKSDNLHG